MAYGTIKGNDGEKMSGSSECEKYIVEGACPANAFEEAKITVPVTVRAYAEVGEVKVKCKGPAIIKRNSDCTPGKPGAVSKFTITQRVRVDIPMLFCCEAKVGKEHVEFESHDPGPCPCPCEE